MFAQLGCLCERFATFITKKWSLSRVCPDMVVQRCRSSKCARAIAALEWLIISVSDNMRAQFVR